MKQEILFWLHAYQYSGAKYNAAPEKISELFFNGQDADVIKSIIKQSNYKKLELCADRICNLVEYKDVS